MGAVFIVRILLCLGITILLSLTVFLNMVAETMPATSEAVPLLGNDLISLNLKLNIIIINKENI